MVITVEGREIAVEENLRFDYVAENPDFDGSGEYSFSIQIPLRDCNSNRRVFGFADRPDFDVEQVARQCTIACGTFRREGTLIVKKLTESHAECQFLAGRSVNNYKTDLDKVYINEIDLGEGYAGSPDCASLPWVNGRTGHVMSAPEYVEQQASRAAATPSGSSRPHPSAAYGATAAASYMPWLLHVAKSACRHLGLVPDFYDWEQSAYASLLVCNCLPPAWGIGEMSRALPHWSVKEFFDQLELLLSGRFSFDFSKGEATFAFRSDILSNAGHIRIDEVVDEFSAEISDEDAEYLDSDMISYADRGDEQWQILCCDWFFASDSAKSIRRFDTLQQMQSFYDSDLKVFSSSVRPGDIQSQPDIRLLYAADVDTYFAAVRADKVSDGNGRATYHTRLQTVNVFGSARYSDEDTGRSERKLQILPVRIDYCDDTNGYCMFLDPSDYSEDYDAPATDETVEQVGQLRQILKGKQDDRPEYYSKLYVAFWPGVSAQPTGLRLPYVDRIVVGGSGTRAYDFPRYSLRLNAASRSTFVVDTKNRYEFKFLADNIPDTSAVFSIKGKHYVCRSITASISQRTGLSKLMKGEFFKIRENRHGQ